MSEPKSNKPRVSSNCISRYMADPKLYSRIKQYLDEQNNFNIPVEVIAENLQEKYSEYSRKKKTAFKKCVQKAYDVLMKDNPEVKNVQREHIYDKYEEAYLKKKKAQQSFSNASDPDVCQSSDNADFSEDNSEYVEYEDKNALNNMISSMYKTKRNSYSAPTSACSSPNRQDNTNQIPGLGKSLFVIDRTGNHPEKVKKKQQSLENSSLITTSTPKPNNSYNAVNESYNRLNVTNENLDLNRDKKLPIVFENVENNSNLLVTPESVKQSFDEKKNISKRSNEEDVSVKSGTGIKKKRKTDKDCKKKGPKVQMSTVTFADVGGNETTLKEVCKLLIHMKHPEVYQQLGVTPPRGFLLHGPPGCGKTLLANAIAGELDQPMIKLSAPEVVSGVSGESEEKLRDIFDNAISCSPCVLFIDEIDCICQKRENASKDMERRIVAQLLSCMDELNAKPDVQVLVIGATNRPDTLDPALRRAGRFDREICMGIPNESARHRILEVLCRGLRLEETFDFHQLARNTPGFVGADLMALSREAAIIAVNRAFVILQETGAGYLNMEVEEPEVYRKSKEETVTNLAAYTCTPVMDSVITPSNQNENVTVGMEVEDEAVQLLHSGLVVNTIVNTKTKPEVAPNTIESTALSVSDTSSQCNHLSSVLHWLKDSPPLTVEQLNTLYITLQDFQSALKYVQPSAKREGFATIPDVTWDDIGALQDIREELEMAILAPVHHPKQFESLGLTNPPGILLAGPPGCGKTLLAKAVANESGLNFISVKGPELLNMYVGESERAVRQVFQRARNSAPCVIFFDELDSLCPRRSGTGEGGSSVRVVNQLLTEMDGLEERKQVFIMGATNRPDIIDPAILRPGRLDKQLYVGLPSVEDRQAILNTITKNGSKPRLSDNVCLKEISSDLKCDAFTGADLAALVREASVIALKEHMSTKRNTTVLVCKKHFDCAFSKVKPSVSNKDLVLYKQMKLSLTTS